MTCNYSAAHESKAWCSLGFRKYEQVRKRRAHFAAASAASRAAAVEGDGAGGGRPQGWGDPYDGERLEPASDGRRTRSATASAARSSIGSGRATASRSGKAAEGRGAGAGFCHGTVDVASCWPDDRGEVCSSIQREPSVANSDIAGIQQPTTHRARARARRGGDSALETCALAGVKKTPENKGESSSLSTNRD